MNRSIPIGFGNLRANPLRTVLSTLGVIIGVASLVAILALGDGLEQFSRSQLSATTDVQLISVSSVTVDRVDGVLVRRMNPVVFDEATADSVAALAGTGGDVAVVLTGSGWLLAEGDTTPRAALITAASAGALPVLSLSIAEGSWFSAVDTGAQRAPAVISASLARVLGQPAPQLLGRYLRHRGGPEYVITGVMSGSDSGQLRAWVPLDGRSIGLLGDDGRSAPQLLVKARRIEDVEPLRQRVASWLSQRYPGEPAPYTVQTYTRRLAQARQGILVFKLIMGSITGISLLVGGIGIMNIMLASVAERTREIGIRKAVGARAADIRLQFLAESVSISGVGAVIGVLLGLAGAFGITAIVRRVTDARMYAGFTWGTVLVAAAAAMLVGIVFGTYPARRAARLSPIDAIRHE